MGWVNDEEARLTTEDARKDDLLRVVVRYPNPRRLPPPGMWQIVQPTKEDRTATLKELSNWVNL